MRVAIVTQDVIGERLAGPAIRALAMGAALQTAGHDVIVGSADEATNPSDLVRQGGLDRRSAQELAGWADTIVVQGDVLRRLPALATTHGTLVCDLYDPVQMEGLVRGTSLPEAARYSATRSALGSISQQLERGDLFLCASERQRLFWLGHLDAAGRVNPATFDRDPTLSDLITVVPFGIEDDPPRRTGAGLRGTVPGLDDAARIVLWGGGLYDWLDPMPTIDAIASVLEDDPTVRLVFMGTKHPNPNVPVAAVLGRARARAAELGISEAVLFHDGWVPYEERQNVLLDAEVGVSGHLPHIETALAFRTRILDYLWAGLPVLTTEGDSLGDLVAQEGLGRVVPPADPGSSAQALRDLLFDDDERRAITQRIAETTASLRWGTVLQPLLDHCASPRPAADREPALARRLRRDRAVAGSERWRAARDLMGAARSAVREEGLRSAAGKARSRAARAVRR